LSWYAIHTRANAEKKVMTKLGSKGVETYLPLFRETHQWKDRRKVIEIPLFPGYAFVRMSDSPENRISVLRTAGAVRILGTGAGIEPVPDYQLHGIRQLLTSRLGFFEHPFLREGAWVRVRRGPLEGVEGHLIRSKAQSRLVLSVEILSRSVATEVELSDVEVIRTAVLRSA
jgi:transcription antitermination factor NusG